MTGPVTWQSAVNEGVGSALWQVLSFFVKKRIGPLRCRTGLSAESPQTERRAVYTFDQNQNNSYDSQCHRDRNDHLHGSGHVEGYGSTGSYCFRQCFREGFLQYGRCPRADRADGQI